MKIEGYEVEEIEAGVKVWTRKNAPHTTFEVGLPWIHFHYQQSDQESDKLGYMETELCCHACETAMWVTFPWPPEGEPGGPIRERFVADHGKCWESFKPINKIEAQLHKSIVDQFGEHPMQSLCPLGRKMMYAVDLRTHTP